MQTLVRPSHVVVAVLAVVPVLTVVAVAAAAAAAAAICYDNNNNPSKDYEGNKLKKTNIKKTTCMESCKGVRNDSFDHLRS